MNSENKSKTCLLIMQKSFYSFEKLIREALVSKEFTVEVANDEYPLGFIGKLMGKTQFPLIFAITKYVIKRKYLNNKKYDLAIIIRGRGIGRDLIKEMKGSVSTIIGYNWDSFRYDKSPSKWFNFVTKYYTSDYSDSKRFSIPYLELFSSLSPASEKKTIEYDISAVVRNYSNRLKYIVCTSRSNQHYNEVLRSFKFKNENHFK